MTGARILALDDDALLAAYRRLRWRVYCLERAWLRADDYPDGLESDAFDPLSWSIGAVVGGVLVAGVRLVPYSRMGLPCLALCDLDAEPRWLTTLELSRLVFDQRAWRGNLIDEAVVKSLCAAIEDTSKRLGATHWLALMERPLARALRARGMPFEPAGLSAEWGGAVRPYLARISDRSI